MSFIKLYDKLINYDGDEIYKDVLVQYLPTAKELIKSVSHISKLEGSFPGEIKEEDLWTLFALSACNDFLLLPHRVSQAEYFNFFSELGMSVIPPGKTFNPVIHEVVGVGNWSKKEEGITIGCCYWQGLRFGDLIFSRCAVDVFCDPSWGVVEGVADESKLYFTNRRVRRKTTDQSEGWGHNSRWRTSYSRNYITDKKIFLNIDGQVDLYSGVGDQELNPLPLYEARELLFNKCFVKSNHCEDDYYPYDWCMVLSNIQEPWPIKNEDVISLEKAINDLTS